jgi:drug/metabolite transporter (DMT)-like permease
MPRLDESAVALATTEQAATHAATHDNQIALGIGYMIAATVMFAVSNALSKFVVAIYPVGEVMFARSLTTFIVCTAVLLPLTGTSVFATRRVRDHLARGLSQSISQTFTVIALSMMPLAGVIAINFSAPLFSAFVAIIWLRERAGLVRWLALVAGFVGVMIVVRPGADSIQVGALFALANAVMYGSVTVAVRGMSKTESANTLLMWQVATLAVFHSFLLVFGLRWPTPGHAALMLGTGVANAAAQYLWTKALHAAPATAVSPFYYFLLVWAALIGFIVWGEIPTLPLLIGSGFVVSSGLFLLYHELNVGTADKLLRLATRALQGKASAATRGSDEKNTRR